MARMLPPKVAPDTASPAERTLWSVIERDLDDNWIVLHSLGLTSHPKKHWAEIDFVLIGPDGVYCLEVKGGTVGRTDGKWTSTSHNGKVNDLGKGPFDQVGGAEGALRRHLRNHLAWTSSRLTGYGVVTPDCVFTAHGADVEPEIVYDARDNAHPFSVYLRRLAGHWQRRYPGKSHVTPKECAQIVDALRGDFALVPSLRFTITGIADELLALTEEQLETLEEFDDNERMIVSGGAGTGKTLLAVEAARRESRAGRRVLLCCFNTALAGHLAEVLNGEPGVDVSHLHGLTTQLIREAGLEAELPKADPSELFDLFHPEYALEALVALDRIGTYDTLILDEAQDLLSPPNLDFLDAVLSGGFRTGRWRVFLDSNQDLFSGMARAGREQLAHWQPARRRLTKNCRNTKPVAVYTSLLTGYDIAKTLVVDGPQVEHHFYRDDAHQQRILSRALHRLLGRGVDPGEIVVLSRKRRENTILRSPIPDGPKITDFRANRSPTTVQHSTTARFKGLESTAVAIVDVDVLDSPDARADLYVACSRAVAILIVMLHENVREDYNRLATEYGKRLSPENPGDSETTGVPLS